MKPAVSTYHDRAGIGTLDGIEDRLDEVLRITRLCELAHLLSQAGRSRLLVCEWLGGEAFDHGFPLGWRTGIDLMEAECVNRTSCSYDKRGGPAPSHANSSPNERGPGMKLHAQSLPEG
jgi:hypothetical protein